MGFSGAVIPGPLLTVAIKESYKRGFWAGPMLVLGHALLEFLLLIGILRGMDSLIRTNAASGLIGLLGGALMLWMSWGMLQYGGKGGLRIDKTEDNSARDMHPVLAGALFSLSNPYWSIWWATIGIGMLIQAQHSGAIGVTFFFLGHISADLLWYSGISALIAKGKKHIPAQFFRGVVVVCGVFLIYLSVVKFIPFGLEALLTGEP